MQLPPSLVHVRAQLNAAILDHAIPAEWDETKKFVKADQPHAIAKVLIKTIREDIQLAKIAYLFKETMATRDRVILGKATKCSGAAHFLHHYDFVITFSWTGWKALTNEQRLALVDHELLHCAFDVESGFSLVHHDVEDFVAIVDRWGLWTRGLKNMIKAVKPDEQRSLFEEEPAKGREALNSMMEPTGTGTDGEDLPPAPVNMQNVGAALATAAKEGEDIELDAPIRRPREPLMHRKARPSSRGKAD